MLNKPETHKEGLTPEEALLEIRAGELPKEHPIQQEANKIMNRLRDKPPFRKALLPFMFEEWGLLRVWHQQWQQENERLELEWHAAVENKMKEKEEKEFAALRRGIGA